MLPMIRQRIPGQRISSYSFRHIHGPKSLDHSLSRDADIRSVARDVLTLTKLNYNTTNFADGEPVTLKFTDSVGAILTAAPLKKDPPPLLSRHYI